MKDQAAKLRQLAARSRAEAVAAQVSAGGRVLAVTSGKGGVGKTNVVANLGTALARRGRSVTVIDADFGLANLDILLNLNPPRNLGHLVRGEADAEEIVVHAGAGFRVVPGASGLEALADLDAQERERLLAALAPLTGDADFVLLDTSAGIGRNVVDLCLAAGEVLLVTNPEPTSLTDAYGLVKVLWARDPGVAVRLVVNSVAGAAEARRVHAKLGEVAGRFLGGQLSYLGHIVRDPCVGRAAQRQLAFVAAYPRSPAARCVEALASALLGEPERRGGAVRRFWRRLLSPDGEGR
ncbi:MAG: MinD/ParA family protein [Deferrisomatales bacterium]